jgi:hypothetical protein
MALDEHDSECGCNDQGSHVMARFEKWITENRHLGRYTQVCHHFKLDFVCLDMMAIVQAAIEIRMYVEGSGTVIGLNARKAGCVPVLQDVRKLPEESNLLIVFSTQFVA